MLPVQLEFPKFVADQLLTSGDLNELFGYLDEQNRLTRTNLLGIGIVCGLQLQVNNLKTQVTITKGCGVTSQGYLVTVDTKSYSQYKKYKVDTPRAYSNFQKDDGIGGKVPMDVWELKQPSVDPDLQSINAGFLQDKVILLFVELKEDENKNCDPSSCDDKGINVTVSFLPMAVSIQDANLLLGTTAGSFGGNTFTALPEIRMKRWDVPNTSPLYTQDIFDSYLKIIDKAFLDSVETTLKNVYTVFGTVVAPDFQTNPFNGLASKYEYLYNGTINTNQLIHLQYFYDLFSDLLLAYQEFRKSGTEVLSTCCPNENLFPRHLLLGEANPSVTTGQFPYRHYFIYSQLFDRQQMVGKLKTLFNRLVLLCDQFFLPAIEGGGTKQDNAIRITPSKYGDIPLSAKSIPYYYQVNSGAKPLYLSWDHSRTELNDAQRQFSYHAALYNPTDLFVKTPLDYDIEPYNFLRIEGIVGKSYTHVLRQVKQQITTSRLPIDIIALNTESGLSSLKQLRNIDEFRSSETGMEMLCHFQDLESMYDSMRKEILCTLCKELTYYYDFTFPLFAKFLEKMQLEGQASEVELLSVCNRGYKIKNRSLGLLIENLHRLGYTDETLTLENFFSALGFDLADVNNDDIPDVIEGQQSTLYLALLSFFQIPLGIIRIASLLTEDLAEFDAKAYCSAADKLSEYAKSLKSLFNLFTRTQKETADTPTEAAASPTEQPSGISNKTMEIRNQSFISKSASSTLTTMASTGNLIAALLLILLLIEDLMDHLDVLIYNCKCSALLSLKADYMRRYALLTRLRQFGFFTKMHPGIQHKAGVTIGGTFIIVYHNRKRKTRGQTPIREIRENESRFEFFETEKGQKLSSFDDYKKKSITVDGIVYGEDFERIYGAKVSVADTDMITLTNQKGVFRLTGIELPFTLVVDAEGYEAYEETFNDDQTPLRVQLQPSGGDQLDGIAEGIVIADFYLPYRCCSDCPPIQYIVNDIPAPEIPNQGPSANAGPDQTITLPTSSVTLSGSASSDADGRIVSFEWVKLTGPGNPVIATPTSTQTDITALEEGVYKFELTVTDDKGAIARASVSVNVLKAPPPPNKPPVANAGEDRTVTFSQTNSFVILDGGNSSDEDGAIVAFRWTQLSGATVNIVSPSLVQTVVNSLRPGVYEFQLTVTDNNGAPNSDTVVITVAEPPANIPPVANAGPDQQLVLNTSTVLMLDGSASTDEDGTIKSSLWVQLSGPSANIISPTQLQTTVTGLQAGTYEFRLTVTDNGNESSSDTVVVTVSLPENQPPIADAGADQTVIISAAAGGSVTLNGSNSRDPEGGLLAHKWTVFSGPNTPNIVSPNIAATLVTGLVAGQYVFRLTVTDIRTATASDDTLVTVSEPPNQAPVADAGPDQTIIFSPNGNNAVNLDGGNSRDPENRQLRFEWKQLPGANAAAIQSPQQAQTLVTGLAVGRYEFGLTVIDEKDARSEDKVSVLVVSFEQPQEGCGPLPPIIDGFDELEGSVLTDVFQLFKEMFGDFGRAEEFFKGLREIENEDPQKHLDFFANQFNGDTPAQIAKWLGKLQEIIVSRKDLRELALKFYRVLVRLSMNIVCIQKEDIKEARVPMQAVFTTIQRHVKQWADLVATGVITEEIQLIRIIGADVQFEKNRLEANSNTAPKPTYLKLMSVIIGIINGI